MKVDFTPPLSPAQELQVELEAFIDRHMEKLLPPVVYRWVKEQKNLPQMHAYLVKHGIALVKNGLELAIYKKGKHVATFKPKRKLLPDAKPLIIKARR